MSHHHPHPCRMLTAKHKDCTKPATDPKSLVCAVHKRQLANHRLTEKIVQEYFDLHPTKTRVAIEELLQGGHHHRHSPKKESGLEATLKDCQKQNQQLVKENQKLKNQAAEEAFKLVNRLMRKQQPKKRKSKSASRVEVLRKLANEIGAEVSEEQLQEFGQREYSEEELLE